jgi:diadenosine tetraphosphate (Ap4A) HIT family hydrolase
MPAAQQFSDTSEETTLDAAEPCWFCRTEREEQTPPGGWIFNDGTWRAGHVPEGWAPAGTVVLEACRHFLDFTEMNADEAATFATTTGKIVAAVKEVTKAERVYLWSTMARYPHLHVWLLPWWQDAPTEGPEYLAAMSELSPCTQAQAENTAHELSAALAGRER